MYSSETGRAFVSLFECEKALDVPRMWRGRCHNAAQLLMRISSPYLLDKNYPKSISSHRNVRFDLGRSFVYLWRPWI
jgi:hypothetical protein